MWTCLYLMPLSLIYVGGKLITVQIPRNKCTYTNNLKFFQPYILSYNKKSSY